MKAIRLAASTSVVLVVALLSVTAASGQPPGPAMNVACSQQALVDAINAANSAGGGTLNLAHGCDYQLTSSPDDSENGLPAITSSITINGNSATIDGTNSFRVFEVDGPAGSLAGAQPDDHRRIGLGLRRRDREHRRHGVAGSHPGDRQLRGFGGRRHRQRDVLRQELRPPHAAQQLGERQPADLRRPGCGVGRRRDPQRRRLR